MHFHSESQNDKYDIEKLILLDVFRISITLKAKLKQILKQNKFLK